MNERKNRCKRCWKPTERAYRDSVSGQEFPVCDECAKELGLLPGGKRGLAVPLLNDELKPVYGCAHCNSGHRTFFRVGRVYLCMDHYIDPEVNRNEE